MASPSGGVERGGETPERDGAIVGAVLLGTAVVVRPPSLLAALERNGLAERTIVVFMGDNGRCLIRGKQWCYDAGTHVPLIANGAGISQRGQVREDPVLSLDMTASTLLATGS